MPAPVLRLNALGGLTLLEDGKPHTGQASQRRRLALLAILAIAGKRGITRDKILSILWADGDPEQSRHALQQSLYSLRRALGADELFVGTTSVALDAERVSSDVAEFEESAERAPERAASVYGGPFLDGFYLDGAPAFERWVERERARLAAIHLQVLETLAIAATKRGDRNAAVRWRRQLASAEPLSANTAVGLIEALVAAGDRQGALAFAMVHEALIRAELETEPDVAVHRWITRLRSGELPSEATTIDASGTDRRDGRTAALRRASPAASGESFVTDATPPPPRTRPSLEDRQRDAVTRALGNRYAIEEQTSFGRVVSSWRARDRRDTRQVEVHVLGLRLTSLDDAESILAALVRAAALAHPHIVPIHDVGMADDVVYYVTEPISDSTLRDRMERDRQLPLADAIQIARDVADALAYAHERHVLHGDLRPKHVVMQGSTALTSFGLVEALTPPAGGGAHGTAVTIGSPSYLSPEQLGGEGRADERSDVYSAGCVLFEMIVGAPPFATGPQSILLSRKLSEPAPSARERRDTVPAALDELLRRCLARLPADRFQTAAELRDALARVALA